MSGIKRFNEKDLVLSVNTKNYDPSKYSLSEWGYFLDILCSDREYQKEAILTAVHYLISNKYKTIEDLIQENYQNNDQLRIKYTTIDDYFSHIQLPYKLSGSIDLATGTGKSYVMYGIAQMALGLGIVDKVLLLGPPSLTIEKELIKKFTALSADKNLKNAIPKSSRHSNPSIINANLSIKEGSICIENINAIYVNTSSSIIDSLGFGKGSCCLVLNDEVHHAYNKTEGNTNDSKSIKKWKEFLLDNSYGFKYILGFTGTSYIDNDYFNDVIYRYSLRSAIEEGFVKNVNYVVENDDTNENEKFQKILQNHKKNKRTYSNLKPLTILVTKDIKHAKQLKTRIVEFLADKNEGSLEFLNDKKVLIVTSDKEHKENVLKLPFVDSKESEVEWIISVAMLTEGWDVKNVFQIVPMEEKAFNSKLLIAQVLGRGLRIPLNYPRSSVTVFNHEKWSSQIKRLVEEILELETRIKNGPLTNGDRAKHHFIVYNIDYNKEMKEIPVKKEVKVFNNKEYLKFSGESFDLITDTKYYKVGDKEYTMTYEIEKEKFPIRGKDGIVERIYNEFQIRRLEGITLKLAKNEYTSTNLPDMNSIEKYIRDSMKNVGLSGDYLGSRNRQVVFAAFNTLLRKKPKSVQLKRKTNLLIMISTQTRDCENMSVLGLRNGDTIFYTEDYMNEIVNKDSLQSLNELINDDSLPRSSFVENINPYLFKTPVDIVFTAKEPERKFVQELIRPENCIKIISWIKSRNQNFYSIEYSLKKGSHASIHNFNPDFFILLKDNSFEYISVVEIKSDGDDNDENKQKYIYACIHFNELNEQLKKANINQKYYFNFLSPANYSDYFAYVNDGRLIKGLYKSELDILLEGNSG